MKYRFVTTNPKVTNHFTELYPWIGHKLPVVVSRKAAISKTVLKMIIQSALTSQGAHGLERLLRENRKIKREEECLVFYAFQLWMESRKNSSHQSQVAEGVQEGQPEGGKVIKHHLSLGISDISDTYITSVLLGWYESVNDYSAMV